MRLFHGTRAGLESTIMEMGLRGQPTGPDDEFVTPTWHHAWLSRSEEYSLMYSVSRMRQSEESACIIVEVDIPDDWLNRKCPPIRARSYNPGLHPWDNDEWSIQAVEPSHIVGVRRLDFGRVCWSVAQSRARARLLLRRALGRVSLA